MTKSTFNRLILAPAICAIIPLLLVPLMDGLAVSSFGGEKVLWFQLLFNLTALAALATLLVSLVGVCFNKTKGYSAVILLCSAAHFAAVVIAFRVGDRIRMQAFHRLADRSKPLIAAIRAYEQQHRHPPETLNALIPDFVPAIPSTGMRAYPNYEYRIAPTNYHGNPWVLTVITPSGGINFDSFLYFPLTNYPKMDFGGTLERVGDWAYVHE